MAKAKTLQQMPFKYEVMVIKATLSRMANQ